MVHALDVDEAAFTAALRNASIVTRSLSMMPRRVVAQPFLLSVVDYIQATPGSPGYQGIQPTGVTSSPT
jgi:NAD(P)H-dependent flavin oxidoreductase YrpB (nitropropane dioxygenase family)